MQKFYYYGMECKDNGYGSYPMKGILWSETDAENKYFKVLVYSKKLATSVQKAYALHFIKCEEVGRKSASA